jgi:SHS2 domain-containing protein
MPYEFLHDIGTADIAFDASGRDLGELFTAAADATTNVMIDNLDAIEPRESRTIELRNDQLDLLLFDFLNELIFFKDCERLLLRVPFPAIEQTPEGWSLSATARGERLDPSRHHQRADVKAVTLHGFKVEQAGGQWRCHVLLDI